MTVTPYAIGLLCVLPLAATVSAAPPASLIERYTVAAKAETPGFPGFSAARGETLHRTEFARGKPDTPACTSCHGQDVRGPGKTRTGKAIEPMAASASPGRYQDPAKVEKWFKRNCNEVLGRECTAREKGDWLAYMASQ